MAKVSSFQARTPGIPHPIKAFNDTSVLKAGVFENLIDQPQEDMIQLCLPGMLNGAPVVRLRPRAAISIPTHRKWTARAARIAQGAEVCLKQSGRNLLSCCAIDADKGCIFSRIGMNDRDQSQGVLIERK